MVTKHYTTDEGYKIASEISDLLKSFPLFDETHNVLASVQNKDIFVGYWTKQYQYIRPQTHIDIQISGGIGDINGFYIIESERQKGNGRALYSCIENFFKNHGCNNIRTSHSGIFKGFWEHMGFTSEDSFVFVKNLSST